MFTKRIPPRKWHGTTKRERSSCCTIHDALCVIILFEEDYVIRIWLVGGDVGCISSVVSEKSDHSRTVSPLYDKRNGNNIKQPNMQNKVAKLQLVVQIYFA